MKKEIAVLKTGGWSLNLEDPYFDTHSEELLAESMDAIGRTKEGHYVNLVTPGSCGDPRDWLIPRLFELARQTGISIRDIRYVDQCGCGGHVTRVYR